MLEIIGMATVGVFAIIGLIVVIAATIEGLLS